MIEWISIGIAACSVVLSYIAFRRNINKGDEDKRSNMQEDIQALKTEMAVVQERCENRMCGNQDTLSKIDNRLGEIDKLLR